MTDDRGQIGPLPPAAPEAHWTHFPAGDDAPAWDSRAWPRAPSGAADRGAPTGDGPLSAFASESAVEQAVVAPLLARWGFAFMAQYPCEFYIGSQPVRGRVDFYVTDPAGRPLTLIEAKARIVTASALRAATGQARSYALHLGLPSFVVAAPEGFWVYALAGPREQWETTVWAHELEAQVGTLRALLIRLQARRAAGSTADGPLDPPGPPPGSPAPATPVLFLPCPACGARVALPVGPDDAGRCATCHARFVARRTPAGVRLGPA